MSGSLSVGGHLALQRLELGQRPMERCTGRLLPTQQHILPTAQLPPNKGFPWISLTLGWHCTRHGKAAAGRYRSLCVFCVIEIGLVRRWPGEVLRSQPLKRTLLGPLFEAATDMSSKFHSDAELRIAWVFSTSGGLSERGGITEKLTISRLILAR